MKSVFVRTALLRVTASSLCFVQGVVAEKGEPSKEKLLKKFAEKFPDAQESDSAKKAKSVCDDEGKTITDCRKALRAAKKELVAMGTKEETLVKIDGGSMRDVKVKKKGGKVFVE